MINQVQGNNLDGGIGNIYLRVKQGNQYASNDYTVLTGPKSNSETTVGTDWAEWTGSFLEIGYRLRLDLVSDGWYWTITLDNPQKKEADVFYTQDLGLGNAGAVESNEAYVSQYIDNRHLVIDNNISSIVSRQNQKQSSGYPALQQGSFSPMTGFSTDGYQFYGQSYRQTNVPEALLRDVLPNENYQYEFSMTALQSRLLTSKNSQVVFYAKAQKTLPDTSSEPMFSLIDLKREYAEIAQSRSVNGMTKLVSGQSRIGYRFLSGLAFDTDELNDRYPNRVQEEYYHEELGAFFLKNGTHVVLPNKERASERATGNIILTNKKVDPTSEKFASTSFMEGVFNSHLVYGNTTFQKFVSNTRNSLNVLKISGQRVYLRQSKQQYAILGMPSAFEMGFNYNRWFYKLADDVLTITVFAHSDTDQIDLQWASENHKLYDVLVTTQIVMGDQEYGRPDLYQREEGKLIFSAAPDTKWDECNSSLQYAINFDKGASVLSESDLLNGQFDSSMVSLVGLEYSGVDHCSIQIVAYQAASELSRQSLDTAKSEFLKLYQDLMGHLVIDVSGDNKIVHQQVEKLNLIKYWYTHDMLIHLLSPHGLEQYRGAAWGTRDVCQGPLEYFLGTGNFSLAKKILLKVFAHQNSVTGNWPQWFMYDQYMDVFSDESHGDVIVWPLKALSEYIESTGDTDILAESTPYFDAASGQFTATTESISDHIMKEVQYIRDHFIQGTYLSQYGDGDWDDTLQPADPKLKENMASSWTVALTYQALVELAKGISEHDREIAEQLSQLAAHIQSEYQKFFEPEKIVPGFIRFDKDGVVKVIHPSDQVSHIHYRLIALTRGIISKIIDQETAAEYLAIIKHNLLNADAVRLMEKPTNYTGGVSRVFQRGEQSANFGREIGLAYIHASIRYVEALVALKDVSAWEFVQRLIPINIQNVVTNALPRQANAYFSSSDAAYSDRYQAQDHFSAVKKMEVGVKGGWKIYSSGPGIFMNQLIQGILGIQIRGNTLTVSQNIPQVVLDSQLTVTLIFNGQEYRIQYPSTKSQTAEVSVTSVDKSAGLQLS